MPSDYLAKTPANFRAELARYKIPHKEVCELIVMNPALMSSLINENTVLYDWAANNIALAINKLSGVKLFEARKLIVPTRGRPRRRDQFPLQPDDPDMGTRRIPGGF